MDERVATLQTIAAETRTAIQDLRSEMRDLRVTMHAGLSGIRTELDAMRRDRNDGFLDMRRVHNRDLRLTWSALIAGGLGLLCLLAHTAHWL